MAGDGRRLHHLSLDLAATSSELTLNAMRQSLGSLRHFVHVQHEVAVKAAMKRRPSDTEEAEADGLPAGAVLFGTAKGESSSSSSLEKVELLFKELRTHLLNVEKSVEQYIRLAEDGFLRLHYLNHAARLSDAAEDAGGRDGSPQGLLSPKVSFRSSSVGRGSRAVARGHGGAATDDARTVSGPLRTNSLQSLGPFPDLSSAISSLKARYAKEMSSVPMGVLPTNVRALLDPALSTNIMLSRARLPQKRVLSNQEDARRCVEAAVHLALEGMLYNMRCEMGWVYVYDRAADELVCVACAGDDIAVVSAEDSPIPIRIEGTASKIDSGMKRTRIPSWTGIVGTVLHSGIAFCLNDNRALQSYFQGSGSNASRSIRALLAIPILHPVEKIVIGVVQVINPLGPERTFSPSDESRLFVNSSLVAFWIWRYGEETYFARREDGLGGDRSRRKAGSSSCLFSAPDDRSFDQLAEEKGSGAGAGGAWDAQPSGARDRTRRRRKEAMLWREPTFSLKLFHCAMHVSSYDANPSSKGPGRGGPGGVDCRTQQESARVLEETAERLDKLLPPEQTSSGTAEERRSPSPTSAGAASGMQRTHSFSSLAVRSRPTDADQATAAAAAAALENSAANSPSLRGFAKDYTLIYRRSGSVSIIEEKPALSLISEIRKTQHAVSVADRAFHDLNSQSTKSTLREVSEYVDSLTAAWRRNVHFCSELQETLSQSEATITFLRQELQSLQEKLTAHVDKESGQQTRLDVLYAELSKKNSQIEELQKSCISLQLQMANNKAAASPCGRSFTKTPIESAASSQRCAGGVQRGPSSRSGVNSPSPAPTPSARSSSPSSPLFLPAVVHQRMARLTATEILPGPRTTAAQSSDSHRYLADTPPMDQRQLPDDARLSANRPSRLITYASATAAPAPSGQQWGIQPSDAAATSMERNGGGRPTILLLPAVLDSGPVRTSE